MSTGYVPQLLVGAFLSEIYEANKDSYVDEEECQYDLTECSGMSSSEEGFIGFKMQIHWNKAEVNTFEEEFLTQSYSFKGETGLEASVMACVFSY